MVLNWLRRAQEDAVSTRLCDLPWSRFSVDTTTEPPAWSPCRNHEIAGDARDLASVDERLRGLRRNLLDGSPRGACKKCPDKPRASPRQLKEHLAVEGVAEGNLLIEAVREVIDEPPVMPPAELMYRVAHTRDAIDFALSGTVSFFDFTPPDRSVRPRVAASRARLGLRQRPALHPAGGEASRPRPHWLRHRCRGGAVVPRQHRGRRLPRHRPAAADLVHARRVYVDRRLLRDHPPEPRAAVRVARRAPRAARRRRHRHGDDDGRVRGASARARGAPEAGRHHRRPPRQHPRRRCRGRLLPQYLPEQAFTEAAWGERFDVLEVIEAGAFNYQDIVVLRKRA